MTIRRAWESLTRKEIIFYAACIGALTWGAAGICLKGREKKNLEFSGLYAELLRALPDPASATAPRPPNPRLEKKERDGTRDLEAARRRRSGDGDLRLGV